MSELEGVKEEIAYLKLWLGIMIATGIGLIGWLLGNFRSAHWLLVGGGFVGILLMGFGCSEVHKRIESKIDEVNPVPRTYVRGFGALPFGEVRNIHPVPTGLDREGVILS